MYNRIKTYQTHQDRHADKNMFKKLGSRQQPKVAKRPNLKAGVKRPINRFEAKNSIQASNKVAQPGTK